MINLSVLPELVKGQTSYPTLNEYVSSQRKMSEYQKTGEITKLMEIRCCLPL